MNKILAAWNGIRMAGLPNTMKALTYTRLRDALDAKFPQPEAPETPQSPGGLTGASAIPGGATFEFESATLTAKFLTPDLLFLAWDNAQMTPSYAVEKTDWTTLNPLLSRTPEGWSLGSNSHKLSISHDGVMLFSDAVDQLIRREELPRKRGNGWAHKATPGPEACIYGLGERAAGLNLRPGKYRCWNRDPGGAYGPGADPLYIGMPVYLCLQEGSSYLAFYDNSFDSTFTLDENITARFEGGPLRYYLAFGAPAQALSRFTELTGRAPLPPRWALGYQHCRWGWKTEEDVRRVFKGFQENKLPLSALYLDIDYLEGYRVFTPDTTRFPTLPAFAAELEKAGVHLAAITDPGVKQDPAWDIFQDGTVQSVFCKDPDGNPITGVVWPGWVNYPDFTDPFVREWWGRQYARLIDHGISGMWHDMNEPVSYAASGDMTLPLCTRHNLDGAHGDHRQGHNVYGMMMNRAGYEGLRKLKPDKRPFILSRSGWAGMQRYSWTWTGDTETSWQALRQTIATVTGLGLSGQPYSGPDTGGFSGHPSKELFIRWFQLSSFLPFFRTHCAMYLPDREPWEFGKEALEILRDQLDLRYRLLPYWYTLAWTASQTGTPPVRPLFWDEPDNQALWKEDDAFLVGDSFLVAPVMKQGERKRKVILPKCGWYDFASDVLIDGVEQVELEAPLFRLPLLVRAGSIIPTVEGKQLTLHVYYPGKNKDCSGLMYSDAGDGYGPSRLDTFQVQEASTGGYELIWKSQGDMAWPYNEARLKLHGFGELEVKLRKE